MNRKDNQARTSKQVQMKPDELHDVIYRLMSDHKYDQAQNLLGQMLNVMPRDVAAWIKLGVCYRMAKQFDAAESCYKKAQILQPDMGSLKSNYANLLSDMQRYDEAIKMAEEALAEKPDDVGLQKNLAFTYRENKQFEKSLEILQNIYKADPKHHDIRFEIAFVMLYLQKYEEAWDLYEYRARSGFSQMVLKGDIARYNGQDLTGKKLLVLGEQGFGDSLLMLRFLPELSQRAQRVDMLVNSALHPLLQDLDVHLVDESNLQVSSYDYCIEMMGLPRLLGKDWTKWPMQPQLSVPDRSKKKFSYIGTSVPENTLKVGVVWSGSVTFKQNHKRSVSYERFLGLSKDLPGAQFFSFQKGPREIDMDDFGRGSIIPLGHMFNDFSETAAALNEMDLIVMTDSAVAHLAGSLGVPVLNLVNYKPYWLYFPETPKTNIYASWRFIRQKRPGDWDQVFNDAERLLTDLISAQAKKPLDRAGILKIIDKKLKA